MCKIFEDFRKEVMQEGGITSAISTARYYGIEDSQILVDVMKRFNLSQEEVEKYMNQSEEA